jgi:hypothetical protein
MNRRIRSSVRTWPDDQEIEAAHVFRQTDATVRRTHQRPDGDNNWSVLFRDCLYSQDRETALYRQIYATHEIVEARVGAKEVQPGIDLYQRKSCRALLVCLLEPEERLLLVFQAGMN